MDVLSSLDRLFDFSAPLDVNLLDAAIEMMYTSRNETERKAIQDKVTALEAQVVKLGNADGGRFTKPSGGGDPKEEIVAPDATELTSYDKELAAMIESQKV